jgi:hypothetical protein
MREKGFKMNTAHPILVSVCIMGASTGLLSGCSKDSSPKTSPQIEPSSQRVQCTAGTEVNPAPFVAASTCLHSGVEIVDQSGTVYEVDQVYSDGRAEATYRDYNGRSLLNGGTYFPEVYSIEGFALKNHSSDAIDGSDTRYSVRSIYANGRVELEYRDYNGQSTSDIRRLAAEVPAYGNIKVGDRLIDGGNTRYVAKEIYSNGRIYAEYVDYNGHTMLNASSVSVAIH